VRPGVALPGGAASLTELVLGVEHLEHFHAYSPRAPPTPPTLFNGSAAAAAEALPPTLPMHVDAGLFISIVPALYLPVPAAAASAAAASGDTGVSAASSSDATRSSRQVIPSTNEASLINPEDLSFSSKDLQFSGVRITRRPPRTRTLRRCRSTFGPNASRRQYSSRMRNHGTTPLTTRKGER
jgi:hypothetical protein